MIIFDLDLLDLKPCPAGRLVVCLPAPRGQANWGNYNIFSGKSQMKKEFTAEDAENAEVERKSEYQVVGHQGNRISGN